jgi:hypothetical protein
MAVPPVELFEWIRQQETQTAKGDDGVLQFSAGFGALVKRLTGDVCGVVSDGKLHAERQNVYAERVWQCVVYHWRRFAEAGVIPFASVVNRIEKGELAYGRVAQSVVWEVTLAQALEFGEPRAAEIFDGQYMDTVKAIARGAGGMPAVDAVENFGAELILPRAGGKSRIASYRGRTPLASWLRAVVTNYWTSRTRKREPQTVPESLEIATNDQPVGRELDETNCGDLLLPLFSQAISTASSEDRFLLRILVLDRTPQHLVAKSMGVSSGTLTRRRERAARQVLATVRELGGQGQRPNRVNECLQIVFQQDGGRLRERLTDALAASLRFGAASENE